MKAKLLPDVEELKKLFYIDSSIPNGLRWKTPNRQARNIGVGDSAGSPRNSHSGIRYFTKINSIGYYNSRIIYSMFNNINLTSEQIVDHEDMNTKNNNPNNLRIVTDTENSRNRRKRKDMTSEFIGVSRSWKKWQVRITIGGITINLGRFNKEKDAAIAYNNYIISHNLSYFNLNNIS